MNKKISLILVIVSLFSFIAVPSTSQHQPLIEELDLLLDGSIDPVHVNQTEDFSYITRIIFNLHWRTNAINWDDFGLIEGGLANGTSISYDRVVLNDPITILHEFAHFSYDIDVKTDGKNPVDNHLSSRLSFFKFVPAGLLIAGARNITFTVADDLTGAGDLFNVILEGYKAGETGPGTPVTATWSPVNILNFWVTNIIPVAAFGIFILVAAIAIWKVATSWR